MKDSSHPEIIDNPVEEARRYVRNAKEILNEKGNLNTELQMYEDRKYVRMAGNTLWSGVLLILDAVFHVKKTKNSRPHFIDYEKAIAKRDLKLLDIVNVGYDALHLSMGYDGNPRKATCQDGIQLANDIIDRCAALLPSPQNLNFN